MRAAQVAARLFQGSQNIMITFDDFDDFYNHGRDTPSCKDGEGTPSLPRWNLLSASLLEGVPARRSVDPLVRAMFVRIVNYLDFEQNSHDSPR